MPLVIKQVMKALAKFKTGSLSFWRRPGSPDGRPAKLVSVWLSGVLVAIRLGTSSEPELDPASVLIVSQLHVRVKVLLHLRQAMERMWMWNLGQVTAPRTRENTNQKQGARIHQTHNTAPRTRPRCSQFPIRATNMR